MIKTRSKATLLGFLIFAILLTGLSFLSKSDKPSSLEIAELLPRSERIQLGKEWESVQNQFVKHRDALLADTENAESALYLASIFINEARITGEHGHYYPAALDILNKVVIESESSDENLLFMALTTKAGVQLSLHDFNEALQTGKKALLLNQRNAQIHGVLVDAYVELGDYSRAIEHADMMMSIKPDLRSYSRVSYLREIHGDVDGAIEAMKLAVKAGYPGTEETAWAMLTLGELFKNYGQEDEAEKVFDEITKIREDYPFAIAALGDLKYQNGELIKAEKLISEAIDIIPEVGFYIQMASLYKDQNREEDLKVLEKEIFEMLEDDTIHGHNMNLEYSSLYLDLLNNPTEALRFAKTEYEKRPNNIDVNLALAKIYHVQGQDELARPYMKVASKTNAQFSKLLKLKSKLKA